MLLRRQLYRFAVSLVLLAGCGLAQAQVRIVRLGFQDLYTQAPEITSIEVEVRNPTAQPGAFELRLVLSSKSPWIPIDTFSQRVDLAGAESRRLEFPLPVSQELARAELRDSQGQLLGNDERKLGVTSQNIVLLFCPGSPPPGRTPCDTALNTIQSTGTLEQQVERGKNHRFLPARELPTSWWDYSAVHTVVWAGGTGVPSPQQRKALEEYVRLGGVLVLVENEGLDRSFLADYRHGRAMGIAQRIGLGLLYRVPDAGQGRLADVFDQPATKQRLSYSPQGYGETAEVRWLRRRLTTNLIFPSLTWLLLWMSAYIVVVGPVNFAILGRLRRREWGWITVPVVSLLFAALLFASSLAGRPRIFHADEVATYWLDEHSSLAAVEASVRVTAPHRANVSLAVPTDTVFTGPGGAMPGLQRALFDSGARAGLNIRFGAPFQLDLSMLRWSFADLEFRGTRRLQGTVQRVSATQLRNRTGRSFREALYVDDKSVYFLGAVAEGAEINLTAARQEPLSEHCCRLIFGGNGYPIRISGMEWTQRDPEFMRKVAAEWAALPEMPFSLIEMVRGWPANGGEVFTTRSAIFYGLADEPVFDSSLAGVPFAQQHSAVFVVSFDKQP